MESTIDLEDRLVKLDKALHKILHSVKRHEVEDREAEIKSLRELVQKIGSQRVDERDTTSIIREMRENPMTFRLPANLTLNFKLDAK